MTDPLLPDRIRVSAKREAEVAKDRHLSTSADRHERWLARWSWVRYPVAVTSGVIWLELSTTLILRLWSLIASDPAANEITIAGIFAAWMGLTTGIFRVLRPLILHRESRLDEPDGNKSALRTIPEPTLHGPLDRKLAKALLFIGRRRTPTTSAEVAEFLDETSALRTEYYLQQLENADLIIEEYADHYSLRPRGRAYIVEHHLDG